MVSESEFINLGVGEGCTHYHPFGILMNSNTYKALKVLKAPIRSFSENNNVHYTVSANDEQIKNVFWFSEDDRKPLQSPLSLVRLTWIVSFIPHDGKSFSE